MNTLTHCMKHRAGMNTLTHCMKHVVYEVAEGKCEVAEGKCEVFTV